MPIWRYIRLLSYTTYRCRSYGRLLIAVPSALEPCKLSLPSFPPPFLELGSTDWHESGVRTGADEKLMEHTATDPQQSPSTRPRGPGLWEVLIFLVSQHPPRALLPVRPEELVFTCRPIF